MTDPTPEERAEKWLVENWNDPVFFRCLKELLVRMINAAVAAERERCAEIAWQKCQTIGIITLFADGQALTAGNLISTAIRADGEPE